ncbi:OmpA family protein [Novosphingobium album (ex Liu et al. 2023)]|uniref:OmpA family protein n=1 Tax=Novosphingobium album (ex Liu et al. 2023) TaxID=3031130 RepID=A0ABT5WL42_9SPHN|nr:OmpA family protein [Novosphingobium album (ex Liu et al. 2023)]MDE8650760.1 OmpA family protein [Novosphingobium album (ex Liu et al. 2023)]
MMNRLARLGAFLPALLLLAGCQTVETRGPYTARQVALLQQSGFEQKGDNWELGFEDKLLFPIDSTTLGEEQRGRIARLSQALIEVGIIGAEIDGHADSTGSAQYNRQISLRRAEAVRDAMQGGGMAPDRLKAIGYGEDRPIESNGTVQGRRENRRVVILVTPADAITP